MSASNISETHQKPRLLTMNRIEPTLLRWEMTDNGNPGDVSENERLPFPEGYCCVDPDIQVLSLFFLYIKYQSDYALPNRIPSRDRPNLPGRPTKLAIATDTKAAPSSYDRGRTWIPSLQKEKSLLSRRKLTVMGIVAVLAILAMVLARGSEPGLELEIGSAESRDRFRSFVTASGVLVAERYADVGSSMMGRVVELPVAEGQEVGAGDLLARIDAVQATSEVEAAEAAIRALVAEAAVATDQGKMAGADLEVAEALAREAKANLGRVQALFDQRLVPASELDSARASAESSGARVNAALAAVARSRSAKDAAERRVTQARAQADRARDLLEKTAIVSPISGVVSRLQVREGEMVVIGIQNQPGTVLMTVSDLSELNSEVLVAEADVLRVTVGQEATVRLEAFPDRTFRGRVTEVGASALPQLDAGAAAREFRVEVRLLDPAPGMRPGLTCDAEILVGEKNNVTVVPLQSVVLRSQEGGDDARGVFVVSDGTARFTPVETGIIGGLDIEVSGIEPGTELVIGPYQVLRDLEDGQQVTAR